jgi:dihydropyrimidinase
MSELDLVVRNGTIVTAADTVVCDIGVRDGRIVSLAEKLPPAKKDIDASGHLVMPGGIDSHCHIEQESGMGVQSADDFYTGSVSAAFGGTTTIIPFAAQKKGESLRKVVKHYHECAGPKAVIDYAFHLIISDPNEQVLGQELPALIQDGYTSFKVYMTYDALRLDDRQMLDILSVARAEGAMVMVHAENHEMIGWLTDRLLGRGHKEPKYHAVAHARLAEGEATHRAICLSELVDTPMLIVHVSAEEAVQQIRNAQARGLRIYGETCPQYLFLTADDLDRDGMEGAKWCCSPPPRDKGNQEVIWQGLSNSTFDVFSSDHAPYRFDEHGKLAAGPDAPFNKIANGVPGIELRLPLLFDGVRKGRFSLQQFVALASTNAARLYGLYPRKGTLAVGSDADIAIWDPEKEVSVKYDLLHDNVGYTPYEGVSLRGWPVTVLNRGRTVVENGELHVERGSGEFLPCDKPDPARPSGQLSPELDQKRNFGANLLGGDSL